MFTLLIPCRIRQISNPFVSSSFICLNANPKNLFWGVRVKTRESFYNLNILSKWNIFDELLVFHTSALGLAGSRICRFPWLSLIFALGRGRCTFYQGPGDSVRRQVSESMWLGSAQWNTGRCDTGCFLAHTWSPTCGLPYSFPSAWPDGKDPQGNTESPGLESAHCESGF